MKLLTLLSIVLTFILTDIVAKKGGDLSQWYIVLGQAHFILAYYYKLKAKKIISSFYYGYAIVAIVLFGSYLYWGYYDLLLFITAFYFVIHFVLDIFFLNQIETNIRMASRVALPLFTIFLSLILHSIQWDLLSSFIFYIAFPLSFISLFFVKREEKWFALLFSSLSLVFFCSRLLEIYGIAIPFTFFHKEALPIIIIAHYVMWYVYYIHKIKEHVFIRTYISNIIIVNFILMTLFFIYINSGYAFGQILFRKDFFFIWTLLHYYWTFRKHEFSLKLSK